MCVSLAAHAAADRPVKFTELPAAAQTFVNNQFADVEVLLATKDPGITGAAYEVMLADGTKIDFDRRGQWIEVERRNAPVPAEIVPVAIADLVARQHRGAEIIGIEYDRRGYDVKLSNGLDLEFDEQFNLIDIDD